MPPGLQRKAVVGRAGDRWEREAESAASQVASGGTAGAITPVTPSALQADRMEEEPLQAVGMAEEEQLQTQSMGEEEPLQTAPEISVPEEELADGGGIQRDSIDPATDADLENPLTHDSGAAQARSEGPTPRTAEVPQVGEGQPLPPVVRSQLEAGLGTDLGHVRVHEGAEARASADGLNARAYTHGSDIYLGSGQSMTDVGLMAHEATHVVQQAGGRGALQPARHGGVVQREGEDTPRKKTWSDDSQYDADRKVVVVPELRVPQIKRDKTRADRNGQLTEIGRSRETSQNTQWRNVVRSKTDAEVRSKLDDAAADGARDQSDIYYLRSRLHDDSLIIGTAGEIREMGVRPRWDTDGVPTRFQIDHIVEWQLGGRDDPSNYFLLEEQANMSSGSRVGPERRRKIRAVFKKARRANLEGVPADLDAAAAAGWRFQVEKYPGTLDISGRPDSNWTLDQIERGSHIKQLRPLTGEEMKAAGGSPEELSMYLDPQGGNRFGVPWGDKATTGVWNPEDGDFWFHRGGTPRRGRRPRSARRRGKNNFSVTTLQFDPTTGGSMTGTLFKKEKGVPGLQEHTETVPLSLREGLKSQDAEGSGQSWAGFSEKARFLDSIRSVLTLKGMSPITLESADLIADKGLVASGIVTSSLPIIEDADLRIVIDGTDVYVSKLFTAGDFKIPGPVDIDGADLELQFGTQGLALIGGVDFSVPNVGEGWLQGKASATTEEVDFALAGGFNFLSSLFDPAEITMKYEQGKVSGTGELGITEGKIRGLKAANVLVTYEEGVLTANGTFATSLPGVEEGTLDFRYGEDGSVFLGGTLSLGADVPGISSGTVEAELRTDAEGNWKISGAVAATPSIPGVTSQITGTYEDGLVTLETTVAYERGMAAGSLRVGVTNRALNEAGVPTGEPGEQLSAFGGGSVTLTMAPWLQATAGISLLPNGEIEVSGEIGLPDALDIFPRREVNKELLSIGLDIPIFGVAAAGQRVGVFARVGGGVNLMAFFGPAQLTNLALGVTWNPDREADTTVTGGATFELPAGAGLRVNVNASLGAGIPLVSAQLGLELGGLLGIESMVRAGIEMNWSPANGLVLDAMAEAKASPVFRFDITGFALVELDLWLKTITLFERRWELAAVEIGSGLELGMKFPLHYEEGQPFEPSIADVELTYPTINPTQLLGDVVDSFV